jgi:hypothetical protein
MATGIVVSGRGDLDVLFKARASAAIANTGFLSNGGVDLAQRFEPRGGTTAIANTNYKQSANDLASLFMDINTAPLLATFTMVAGLGTADIGFRNTASGYAAYGSQSITPAPDFTKTSQAYRLDEIASPTPVADFMMIRVSHATTTPANADTTWQWIALTGTFASGTGGGGTGRRLFNRVSIGTSVTGTTPSGRPTRNWQMGSNQFNLITGNSYTIEIA